MRSTKIFRRADVLRRQFLCYFIVRTLLNSLRQWAERIFITLGEFRMDTYAGSTFNPRPDYSNVAMRFICHTLVGAQRLSMSASISKSCLPQS